MIEISPHDYKVNVTLWEPHADVISEFQPGDLLKCIDLSGNTVLCTIVNVSKKYTKDHKLIRTKIEILPEVTTLEDVLTRDGLLKTEHVWFEKNKWYKYPVWNIGINTPKED